MVCERLTLFKQYMEEAYVSVKAGEMNQTRSSITYYVVCRQERKTCYLVKYIMIECEYKTIYYRTVQYCSYNTVTILQNSLQ